MSVNNLKQLLLVTNKSISGRLDNISQPHESSSDISRDDVNAHLKNTLHSSTLNLKSPIMIALFILDTAQLAFVFLRCVLAHASLFRYAKT